ncbi:MAG: hypothetical protein M3X11_12240 [Acidobacteriota bacterium]|nr:hypothetical protein [Acidobacteriota bacterium]
MAIHLTKAAGESLKLFCRVAAASALLLFFIATAGYGWRQFKIHNQLAAAENGLIRNNMDAPEYRPRWADRDSLPSNRVGIVEGSAEVSIESRQPRRFLLGVNAASRTTMDVPQFYFPGWQWRLAGASVFQDAQASPQSGLVRITVPGGSHRIELRLNASWPERSGQVISVICCVVLILIGARRQRH